MLEDVAYPIRTPEFWNACSAICGERDFRLGGINVISTARSLG